MSDILELHHVFYTYGVGTPFRTEALHDVSVSFAAGETTGLIGHTGSGKSTLVQMLNGLLRPDAGEVLLAGENIWDRPKEIRHIRFRVGLVMQYPEYQLFDETVERDIGFAPRNLGLEEAEIRARVEEAVDFVGIPQSLLGKSPFDLSGGQKRRVAIAGVLAMRPEVLVLDEPAAGLDPRGRREILGGLTRYREQTHSTVILVSHSMEDMATYCDRIVVMDHGKVYANGTTEEIFRHPAALTAVGLDIPQVAHVAESLRTRGVPLTGSLYTVAGVRDALLKLLDGEVKP